MNNSDLFKIWAKTVNESMETLDKPCCEHDSNMIHHFKHNLGESAGKTVWVTHVTQGKDDLGIYVFEKQPSKADGNEKFEDILKKIITSTNDIPADYLDDKELDYEDPYEVEVINLDELDESVGSEEPVEDKSIEKDSSEEEEKKEPIEESADSNKVKEILKALDSYEQNDKNIESDVESELLNDYTELFKESPEYCQEIYKSSESIKTPEQVAALHLIKFKAENGYRVTYDDVGRVFDMTKQGAKKAVEKALEKFAKRLKGKMKDEQ